jgi:hypothetical protein
MVDFGWFLVDFPAFSRVPNSQNQLAYVIHVCSVGFKVLAVLLGIALYAVRIRVRASPSDERLERNVSSVVDRFYWSEVSELQSRLCVLQLPSAI